MVYDRIGTRRYPCLIRAFFFFNDTATTEIYTLSLHDALPIWPPRASRAAASGSQRYRGHALSRSTRSEEHTSELQSLAYLVCRLLLEKKKKKKETRRNRCHSRSHARLLY